MGGNHLRIIKKYLFWTQVRKFQKSKGDKLVLSIIKFYFEGHIFAFLSSCVT